MPFTIEFHPKAAAELGRLDYRQQLRIVTYLRERIGSLNNPRALGSRLRGPLKEFWKYRVGSYRIICDVQEARLRVLVLRVGHRREIYR